MDPFTKKISENSEQKEEEKQQSDELEKISDTPIRDSLRSRFQSLCTLYSNVGDLSSPIRRTENNVNKENTDKQTENVLGAKPKQNLGKLAASANSTKRWEDDTSHTDYKCVEHKKQQSRNPHQFLLPSKLENKPKQFKWNVALTHLKPSKISNNQNITPEIKPGLATLPKVAEETKPELSGHGEEDLVAMSLKEKIMLFERNKSKMSFKEKIMLFEKNKSKVPLPKTTLAFPHTPVASTSTENKATFVGIKPTRSNIKGNDGETQQWQLHEVFDDNKKMMRPPPTPAPMPFFDCNAGGVSNARRAYDYVVADVKRSTGAISKKIDSSIKISSDDAQRIKMNSSNNAKNSETDLESIKSNNGNCTIATMSIPTIDEDEGHNKFDDDNIHVHVQESKVNYHHGTGNGSINNSSAATSIVSINELENYLDEALDEVEETEEDDKKDYSASTKRKNKSNGSTTSSNSFCYQKKDLQQQQQPQPQQQYYTNVNNDNDNHEHDDSSSKSSNDHREEQHLVQDQIKCLLVEVAKQQQIMAQTSQALNLCTSTIEFSGSSEAVECERHLLLATHRHKSALDEIQRLKIEGTLRPIGSPKEKGSLSVKEIIVPLKDDYVKKFLTNTIPRQLLVCLLKYGEIVLATKTVATLHGLESVQFRDISTLNVYADFKITLEIYGMTAEEHVLPHEVKYHINLNKKKTPKKKGDGSMLTMPRLQFPAGPNVIRTPALMQYGYAIFSLDEIQRDTWTLTPVSDVSPLKEIFHMKINCELSVV